MFKDKPHKSFWQEFGPPLNVVQTTRFKKGIKEVKVKQVIIECLMVAL